MTKIIPAILTDNPKDLKEKLANLNGLTDWVQIDIMDGLFVPQTSIEVKELIGLNTTINFDIHLMVNNPEQYLGDCQKAQAKRVIFQLEGTDNPDSVVDQIKALDCEAGIALNPKTPLKDLASHLDQVDVVLLLSVNPGKQGQKFIPGTLEKIKGLKKIAPRIKIEVDGGVNKENIKQIAQAGADYIVVGSAIFKQPNIAKALAELQAKISN